MPNQSDEPLICAVVVARNEAATVEICLTAAQVGLESVGGGEVLLVDSASTDGTVRSGVKMGCRVLAVRTASRICPSAMRYLGASMTRSRYILFLDGDCELESGFLPRALEVLEEHNFVGVVAGKRQDFYRTARGLIRAPQEYYAGQLSESTVRLGYGGCAVYRRKALEEAGSFDPFLRAEEEQDLAQRIRAAGYQIKILPIPMIRHMTVPRESLRRLLRSLRHGFYTGRGEALRKFLGRGEIRAAFRGLDRTVLAFANLGLGVMCLVAWAEGVRWPLIAWVGFSLAVFAMFAYRSRSLFRAGFYVSEWLVRGACILMGMFSSAHPAASYHWEGEEVSAQEREVCILPRVLLVGPLPPLPIRGGVEKGVKLLLRGNLARGTDMQLFNTSRRFDPDRSLWRKLRYQLGIILRYRQTLKNRKLDLVHVKTSSGINFLQNSLYVHMARLAGLPVLLQIHSGRFEAFYLGSSTPMRAWIRYTLSRSTRVAVLSQRWADRIETIAPKARIRVIPNGLPREEIERLASRMVIRAGQVFFLGTGKEDLNRDKGLDDLLAGLPDLWHSHSHSRWVLAGLFEPDVTYGELRRKGVDPDGTEPRVHCLGVVNESTRERILQESTILALPSHFENMPNVLLEAMAAGLGVVATEVGAIPEMIGELGGILIRPGDREALLNALSKLLASPALAEAQGKYNSEAVSSHYTMEVVEACLQDLYLELYEGPGHSRDARRVGPLLASDPRITSSGPSTRQPVMRP